MKTTSDERLGVLAVFAAGIIVAFVMREPLMFLAVFLGLFGPTLAIKSWLAQSSQETISKERSASTTKAKGC